MWKGKGFRIPGRPKPGAELEEEISFHLDKATEEGLAMGLSPEEARARARARFGNLEQTRRYCLKQDRMRLRRERMGSPFRMLRDEFVHALRSLARRPRQVTGPLLILAMAIALNVLVLSVVRGVLLSPLPFQDTEHTLVAEEVAENGGLSRASYPVVAAWRRDARLAENVVAFLDARTPLMFGASAIHVDGAKVTEDFFELFENPIRTGRSFLPEEHQVGGPRVVAISEGLWIDAFGRDPDILSRSMEIEGIRHQIVAVVRAESAFPEEADFWMPVEPSTPQLLEIAGAKILTALVRIRPGVTGTALSEELAEISDRVQGGAAKASVVPVEEELLGDVRRPLLLLQGAVLLVLLASAVNAGSLLLSRGVRRRGEVALKVSLGAGSGRVVTGLLLEGVILGSGAGLAGLLAAALALGPVLNLVPVDLPRAGAIALDPWVISMAMVLALGTGIATSLIPALAGSRASPSETLRESSGRGGMAPWIRATLEGFVVAQVAFALVLTVGAGLLLRSFISTIQEDPGFDPAGITLLDLSLPEFRYPDQDTRMAFSQELLARARSLPGAEAAALGRNLPISGSNMTSPLRLEGLDETTAAVQVAMVTDGYFRIMGIPILEGTGFGDSDRVDGPQVIIVDTGVRTPDGVPLRPGDRAHSFFGDQEFREVIGVAGPVRHGGLRSSPAPIAYEPFFQKGGSAGFTLLVRSRSPAGVVAQEARRMVLELDPQLAVDQITSMDARIRRSLAEPRFYTVVLSVFGVLAVVLALSGCQAGLAHRVATRRKEIGIRVALGAPRTSVRKLILGRGLFLTGGGIVLGLLLALPGARLLESQLYGVTPVDPITYLVLVILLLGAAALASDRPARRAAALDPAAVLKEE